MMWAFSTWREIEASLEHSRTVVIPIGSTEQHGPTGLLGTDWLCPEIIAHEAEKRAPHLLVAPTCNVGMAQHHLAFAGTISLRPSTLRAVLHDWVRSLTAYGFERLYFLNGHGGNIASIEAAFSELYAKTSFSGGRCAFACKLQNWWEFPEVDALAQRQFPFGHGAHATPAEIAITQWAYPKSCKVVRCDPEIAPSFPFRDAADFRAKHPDGRMGSQPLQASPAAGGELVEVAVKGLIESVNQFSQALEFAT